MSKQKSKKTSLAPCRQRCADASPCHLVKSCQSHKRDRSLWFGLLKWLIVFVSLLFQHDPDMTISVSMLI
ncbi:hypothetical protein ACPUEK_05810 [Marinomonas gallaica]|uniref:hypothetical protein n=1 Tax=Marinomonas gallaica TaxID=1806667 RepID=UPI003CE5A3B2